MSLHAECYSKCYVSLARSLIPRSLRKSTRREGNDPGESSSGRGQTNVSSFRPFTRQRKPVNWKNPLQTGISSPLASLSRVFRRYCEVKRQEKRLRCNLIRGSNVSNKCLQVPRTTQLPIYEFSSRPRIQDEQLFLTLQRTRHFSARPSTTACPGRSNGPGNACPEAFASPSSPRQVHV